VRGLPAVYMERSFVEGGATFWGLISHAPQFSPGLAHSHIDGGIKIHLLLLSLAHSEKTAKFGRLPVTGLAFLFRMGPGG
jgi:hypothetical protein